jgi:fucose 4-O-acetylase-like acetyltransferase
MSVNVNGTFDRKKDYFSLENTTCLKGILAVCVVISHLWGMLSIGNSKLSDGFIGLMIGLISDCFAYLSVAMFLFISGYGLYKQYEKQGAVYINRFLQKRVLPLYLINVILIVFYSISNAILANEIPWLAILQSFLFGGTIVSKGWYIQAIIVWYLLFFMVFKFIKNDKLKILTMIGAYFIYLAVCLVMELSSTWYEGAFCLVLGIIYAKYFNKLNEFIADKKRFVLSILLFIALFFVVFFLSRAKFLYGPIRIVARSISACLFTINLVLFLKIIPINNVATRFLGKIGLEIYVFHGFFLTLYRNNFIYIDNMVLYCVLVLISSIVFAWIMHPIFFNILKIGTKSKK